MASLTLSYLPGGLVGNEVPTQGGRWSRWLPGGGLPQACSSGAVRLYLALVFESLTVRCAWYVPWPHVPSRCDQHHKGPETLACTPYPHVTALSPLCLHLVRPPSTALALSLFPFTHYPQVPGSLKLLWPLPSMSR